MDSLPAITHYAMKVLQKPEMISKGCNELIMFVQKLIGVFSQLVKLVTENVDHSSRNPEISYKYKAKNIIRKMPEIFTLANSYLDRVGNVFCHVCNEASRERVMRALRVYNQTPLKEVIGLLCKSLSQATQHHSIFMKFVAKMSGEECGAIAKRDQHCNQQNIKTTETRDGGKGVNCHKLAEECEHKAKTAKNQKLATEVIGGTLSAVATAGGIGSGVTLACVTASVAAGSFTFGLGTVIGLGLTATAGVAMGVVGSVTTHLVASDFKTKQGQLEKLSTVFNTMCDVSVKSVQAVSNINSQLQMLEQELDIMEYCQQSTVLIHIAVDQMFDKLTECYALHQSCRVEILSLKKEIDELQLKLNH